jgi:hypothetical protein
MNAVATEARSSARAPRRLDGREQSAIDSELERWGEWWEKNPIDGFSGASSIAAFLEGFGGGRPGHRILCEEMPNAVFWTHQRWLRLSPELQITVWVHFVPRVDPDTGRCWTPEERASLLEIPYGTYRVRLTRARYAMLGLDAPT